MQSIDLNTLAGDCIWERRGRRCAEAIRMRLNAERPDLADDAGKQSKAKAPPLKARESQNPILDALNTMAEGASLR